MSIVPKMTFAEMAALECKAAVARWGEADGRKNRGQGLADRIQPFLGTGVTGASVARELGVSGPAVSRCLKRMGAKL